MMAKSKNPNVPDSPADPANGNVALSAAAMIEPRDNTSDLTSPARPESTHSVSQGIAGVADDSETPSLEDRIAALEAKLAEALSSLEAKVSELDGHVFRLTR